jgi:pyroglutamyl-peptidase
MRVVLAGFGPFPGMPFNPSAALVKALARRRRPAFADVVISTHVFATRYAAVDQDLAELAAQKPDLVLMFGVARRRRYLGIETRARNAQSVLYPDASGHRPARATIAHDEGGALRGSAPFSRLLGAVRPSGFPARLSRDAGRYLCNYAYWRALESTRQTSTLVQFIHIPQIRSAPRRRRSRRSAPGLPRLVAAAEMLLVALIAALCKTRCSKKS